MRSDFEPRVRFQVDEFHGFEGTGKEARTKMKQRK